MSTLKAVWYAVGVTAVSAVCLTIVKGPPTAKNAIEGCALMFVAAFVAMKIWGGKEKAVTQTVALREAKFVVHHDDPPCTARLVGGHCPACGFTPDSQSICLCYHCPDCDVEMRFDIMKETAECPECGQTFTRSRSYLGKLAP